MSDFSVKAVLGVGAFGKVFLGARRGGLGSARFFYTLFPIRPRRRGERRSLRTFPLRSVLSPR
jgi:hypothetical protein